MHIHRLDGCAPVPLAHYLKALGILRLVSAQLDPKARGWWAGDLFMLATVVNRDGIQRFFLESYSPTPLVSPWNKGSGFFDDDPVLTPFEQSTAVRFAAMREGIAASRALLRELTEADRAVRTIKAESKAKGLSRAERERRRASADYKRRLADAERRFKELKAADLLPQCLATWRGRHRDWIDAALVSDEDGRAKFPALLGTGGNDGRLDFTNNFMQRIAEVYELKDPGGRPVADAGEWLRGALWSDSAQSLQAGRSTGQFLPGGAGGANSSNGPFGDSFLNPFDFILMLEGAIVFRAHLTRRLSATAQSRAAAPFVVGAHASGYASASTTDESARGEQWMPLWRQPLSFEECRHLFGEGRAQIGARPADAPLDLARAIARMGTARGISSFQRYGFIERNGQSNLAVPIGRFHVHAALEPLLVCLDDIDTWIPRVRAQARAVTATSRLQQAERRLTDLLFDVTQHPGEGARWQAVLAASADVEAVIATGSGFQAGPIPRLRPEWVRAAYRGTDAAAAREIRLAVSLALQRWRTSKEGAAPPVPDRVRRHWLHLNERDRFVTSGTGSQARLLQSTDVVMSGRRGEDDAIALVERRLVEGSQKGERRLPLVAAPGTAARLADLVALMAGQVSVDRVLQLARAFMALDPVAWASSPARLDAPPGDDWPDDAWLTIRLALLPWPLGDTPIGADPAIVRRLAAGDVSEAFDLARRRLGAAGIRSNIRLVPGHAAARLWAAALAFPISRDMAHRFRRRLDPLDTTTKELPR